MEKGEEKITILVDGNNLYKGLENSSLRSRFDLRLFDYDDLANFLGDGRAIAQKLYYKGVVRKEVGNPKSQKMVSEQQRVFNILEKNGWRIRRGRMSKNIEFGECEGFYFSGKRIANKHQLNTTSKEILKEHQFHYRPIVIISKENPLYTKLQKALDNIKDDGKGLKSLEGVYFALNRWREKGVDVNIAIDMLTLGFQYKMYQNKILESAASSIILVSSDSDLKPVVEKVQSLGITVEYVGFTHMYSIALLNTAKKRLLLTEKQLEEFFPRTLLSK